MRTGKHLNRHQKISLCFVLSLIIVLLTSCSAPKDYQSLMKKVTTSDNSFTAGYLDGCDSGLSENPEMTDRMYFQDMIRYKSDKGYSAGWDNGLKKCSR